MVAERDKCCCDCSLKGKLTNIPESLNPIQNEFSSLKLLNVLCVEGDLGGRERGYRLVNLMNTGKVFYLEFTILPCFKIGDSSF